MLFQRPGDGRDGWTRHCVQVGFANCAYINKCNTRADTKKKDGRSSPRDPRARSRTLWRTVQFVIACRNYTSTARAQLVLNYDDQTDCEPCPGPGHVTSTLQNLEIGLQVENLPVFDPICRHHQHTALRPDIHPPRLTYRAKCKSVLAVRAMQASSNL